VEIPTKLKEEIIQYCKSNDIENVDRFILKMLKQGFNVEKYGMLPQGMITQQTSDTVQPVNELFETKDIPEKNNKESDKDLYGE